MTEADQGPGGGEISVDRLTAADLDAIVWLHQAAFPASELGRFGDEAVRRSYRWQFDGPHDLTAVAGRKDGRLVGFVLGGVFRGATIGFIKRERWFLIGRVLRRPQALFNRVTLDRLGLAVRLLFRRQGQPESAVAAPNRRSFGILSIAVDPAEQGSGVGRVILDSAERSAVAGGFEEMHLTVHPTNQRAERFYERSGWERDIPSEGTWQGRMVKRL